ncbi:aminotransferase class I/II-fold pyridoxal phosphate-dependent enzyme [Streptomyces sp. Li-HN-5-11]|uniref:DegT/DnrJ/EryC1/StrS family aminotransferase n=1 Tax=Streptomyces sp. Li-HN-5-11 TaxID=3075432 RepID=UPI0028AC7D77|nr:aminotransferase class I/II-fold pyridoxal phosphate-dependent enzyme [Streptomyces sp. Li-HN-5-11]WNM35528.1 aminotransferase class I/II-fold pyridoxal phosphate-dependent enzyme [Streptomyces sp. Li-HN-5-11]
MRFPLSQPTLGKEESDNVRDAMTSGWISGTGPYVSAFERALEQITGRASATAVSSGTTALELVLSALGVGPGDEVVVPALTFAAPAAAVLTVGAVPVLCDIDPGTWTIDPDAAGDLLTPRTKAVIAVDLMGHPCDYERLAELEVPIVEDAAQAHGARTGKGPAGGFGIASIFSFHVNKAITTGEGGAVLTDDPELADRVRLLAHHGMKESSRYHHSVAGRNGRMTNLSAAIGTAQAGRWDELVAGRAEVGRRYDAHLAGHGFTPRPKQPWASPSCWLYCVTAPERDAAVERARRGGVDARAIWPALSDLPLYREYAPRPCVHASRVSSTAMWLPTWSHMPEEDVAAVAEALR